MNFLARKIKRELKANRECFILKMCKECKVAAHIGNIKQLYSNLRVISGKRSSSGGSNISREVWENHFNRLFTELAHELDANIFERLEQVADSSLADELRGLIPDGAPTMDELEFELNAIARDKAVGPDNVCVELYQHAGKLVLRIIHRICVLIFENNVWPVDWADSIMVTLFKKGSMSDPDNYRGITLVAHASKLLCGVIRRRCQIVVSRQVGDFNAVSDMGEGQPTPLSPTT